MRDLPHHMKKINRKIVRSMHREQTEEEAKKTGIPPYHQTNQELKKIAKRELKEERESRTPIHPSEDERNRQMKERVPIFFDQNSQKPKVTRPTRKKTPRI
jgi:hypothetical protein